MTDPLHTFRAEAGENLVALEEALLELEQHPDDAENIGLAFRAMHTIKGAGGIFGFDALSAFTHHLETVFDRIRSGEARMTPELVTVMLDARDHIEGLLGDPEPTAAQRDTSAALLARLHAAVPEIVPVSESGVPTRPSDAPRAANDDGNAGVYRIRFTPAASAFTDGFDVAPILTELAELGESVLVLDTTAVPLLGELNPEICHLAFDVTLLSEAPRQTIEDVFIFVADEWDITIEALDIDAYDDDVSRLGEVLVARGVITRSEVADALEGRTRTGELLTAAGLVSESDVKAALGEQNLVRNARERKATSSAAEPVVRVPASRLDALMNLVGELVIVQARMNQLAQSRDDEDMLSVAEDLDRLTSDLRDNTLSIRMVPIGSTFSRFRRLVRDLSRDLGKQVQLTTEGADTELDKMVIDRLGDPLVHLIRNSIDHGIESPEIRASAGKPPLGTVHLAARHAESHVVIRIGDDGRGLDTEVIRAKAIERGLIAEDDTATDVEIQALIFEPGFSTARTVSDVSGRGVGMDVVKRSIQDLGGQVTIDSTLGVGTTITITLPLTLAIIEGLMVAVSDERYVLPLSSVEECVELKREQTEAEGRKRLVDIRGELVPFMRLRDWFDVPGDKPDIEQIVVTRLGEERFGFSVDEVIGQYQTVIKRLGKIYEGVEGLAGATVLGDGGVAMILDAAGLAEALGHEARV